MLTLRLIAILPIALLIVVGARLIVLPRNRFTSVFDRVLGSLFVAYALTLAALLLWSARV
jgi:hypothetical protein